MEDLKSGIEHLRQAKAHMSKANGIMSNCISKLRELEEENAGLRAKLEAFIQSDDSYMKLPLDADGVPIRIGDTVYTRDAEEYIVRGIYALADEYSISVVPLGGTCFLPMEPEGLTHKKPEPLESEVLDADGVPIEVGDTVYCDDDPEQLMVDSFDDPGCVYLTLAKSPNGILYTIEPSRLSHECPDSWEKLEEDATQQSCGYFGMDRTPASCDDCPHGWEQTGRTCWRNARLDMIARAKKLAGIEKLEGEER